MADNDTKDKSITRAKKSAISIADILVEAGVDLVPGGGISYKLIKTIGSHISSWWQDHTKQRLEDFHEKLIYGIPLESQEEFLRNKFSIADYYSLLTHVVGDEEDEKVDIYVRLLQGLILGVIPQETKLHLIKAIRELKFSDFDFMRQIYISEKYEFKQPIDKKAQIKLLTLPTDPIKCYAVQTLIRLGFLYEKDGTRPPWPTGLLKMIVELLYEENDLTAEAIGKTAKTAETERLKIFIACDQIGFFGKLLSDIGNKLHQHEINNVIGNPVHKSIPLIITPAIAICVHEYGSPIQNLNKYANLDKKIVIQLLMPGSTAEKLPLKDAEVFDFTQKGIEAETNRLIEFIHKQLKRNTE